MLVKGLTFLAVALFAWRTYSRMMRPKDVQPREPDMNLVKCDACGGYRTLGANCDCRDA